jgi:gamma-D-glutamyl-L-lysine dipeptidyl-peptidase
VWLFAEAPSRGRLRRFMDSCRVEIAPVRREPRGEAEQVTQLLRGEPVTVHERRDGWARIETAYAYPGWVREEALGEAMEGEWLVRRQGDVLAEARFYLGAPYEWGGMSERGIDCSGLIHMAFRRLGILVPRDSWQQEEAGEPVAEADLRPGDVICYEGHAALWAGNGRILHAFGRDDVRRVVEEAEPPDLAARRHSIRRFSPP